MMSIPQSSRNVTVDQDPSKEEKSGKVREVGSQAVWSLSSCKPGNNSK